MSHIRPAKLADADCLARIDSLVSISPQGARQFERACAEPAQPGAATSGERVLVLEAADHICGFVLFSRVLDEATILNIAIDPAQQGRGLGRQLLGGVLETMKCDGATRCLLEVRESNTPAQALYKRAGFELDAVRRNYYPTQGGREDALLMSMPL